MGIVTGLIVSGLISALGSAGASIGSNIANYKATKDTNDTNERIANNTNDVNKEIQAAVNAANLNIARENNAFSANEAYKARQWQEEMSNTAHQREMADLKAAGINPILAATGGAASLSSPVATVDYGGKSQAAEMKAYQHSAPRFDFNGVASALNAVNNLMLTQSILKGDNLTSKNKLKASENYLEMAKIQNNVNSIVHDRKNSSAKKVEEVDPSKLNELLKLIG